MSNHHAYFSGAPAGSVRYFGGQPSSPAPIGGATQTSSPTPTREAAQAPSTPTGNAAATPPFTGVFRCDNSFRAAHHHEYFAR